MKHAIIAMAALLVVGCSNHPLLETSSPASTTAAEYKTYTALEKSQEIIDPECSGLARYARSISLMKNLGVSFEEIDFILPNTPMNFPKEAIQREIYTSFGGAPADISVKTYLRCVRDSYDTTVIRLKTQQVQYEMNAKEEAFAVIQTRGNGGLNLRLSTALSKWKKR
jgi:hypothetical protein